ncbi:MAG: ABC transporter ATP-binding protein [Bacteroidota bacterium]
MAETILRTHALGKRYKTRWAVTDLNLEIHRGDIFGFLGPNGAGKSTTIRMLLSLLRPTTGDIELFGYSLARNRRRALAPVGGLVEEADFYLYLTAFRNLEMIGDLAGGIGKKKINEVLETVGLYDRAGDKVKTYSHGMKQRLGIAQALLTDPELVILDEPTTGLDPQGMKEVRDLILHLSRERNITVFLSSHLLHEIELVATRMAIINKGKLVVQGNVADLLNGGENWIHLTLAPQENAVQFLTSLSWIQKVDIDETGVVVQVSATEVPRMVSMLVNAGFQISAVTPRRSLEEYFLSITG